MVASATLPLTSTLRARPPPLLLRSNFPSPVLRSLAKNPVAARPAPVAERPDPVVVWPDPVAERTDLTAARRVSCKRIDPPVARPDPVAERMDPAMRHLAAADGNASWSHC